MAIAQETVGTDDAAAQASEKDRKKLLPKVVKRPADLPASPEQSMAAGRRLPLLVYSIGNPGREYANTLHSAGHTVINALAERLGHSGFTKHNDKVMQRGLVSEVTNPQTGTRWTLWQSAKYMNESGKGVSGAFQAWSRHLEDGAGRLVVIHDELEKPLGNVLTKTNANASAKGHNGLKSIMTEVGNRHEWARIGIGIGRPESRDREDVSSYVLKKMHPTEKSAIEGAVDKVVSELQRLEAGL